MNFMFWASEPHSLNLRLPTSQSPYSELHFLKNLPLKSGRSIWVQEFGQKISVSEGVEWSLLVLDGRNSSSDMPFSWKVFTEDVQDFESLRGARAFPMPLHLA